MGKEILRGTERERERVREREREREMGEKKVEVRIVW